MACCLALDDDSNWGWLRRNGQSSSRKHATCSRLTMLSQIKHSSDDVGTSRHCRQQQQHEAGTDLCVCAACSDALAALCYSEITNAKRERRPIERLTTEMLASWSITQTDLLRVLADYPELECCFEPMARMTNLRNDTDRYSESTFERGQLPEFEPELDDYDLTLDDSQPSYPETSAIECVPEMQHPSETYENDFQDIMRTILMPRKKAQKTFGSHNVDAGAFGSHNKHASSSSSSSSTTTNATRAV